MAARHSNVFFGGFEGGREMTGNGLKTALLLGGLTAVLLLLGYGIAGESGMLLGFGIAAVMNIGAYWFSDKVALRMAGAREVSEAQAPELHSLVANIAQTSGLPKPRVALIESPAPNAFATGRNPQNAVVAVTSGILEILDRRELAAVLAHELGHVRNRDILIGAVAATIAAAFTMLARFALFFGGRDSRDNPLGPFAMLFAWILAPIGAVMIQMAISRSREAQADRSGAELIGDATPLATALIKIDAAAKQRPEPAVSPAVSHLFLQSPFRGKGISKLFMSHPPLEERLAQLRELGARV
jgi:heat shock protein HtpX